MCCFHPWPCTRMLSIE
uniref:Uncharacterized protein n=1 Tax=Anguilla anguilla TaxID=7936 RepID=A0A0E9PTY1_ANGAN